MFVHLTLDPEKKLESINNVIRVLQSQISTTAEKVAALEEFQSYVHQGDSSYIKQNFKYVFALM